MSTLPSTPLEPVLPAGRHPAWLLLLLPLCLAQAWLTAGLLGPARPWDTLLDDRPILSGRHPLHLYHGILGSRAFRDSGTLSCYDPAFQAGYPKTPVFDASSRPAELALTLAGGSRSAAVYKVGLAILCLLVPLTLYAAARNACLARGPACLVCLLGLLVWWSKPGREALEAGDLDLLLAGLAAVAQASFLVRYHYRPDAFGWCGVVGSTLLGWYSHPGLLAVLFPVGLAHYIGSGCRHSLNWHLALLLGLAGALAVNSFWLLDWFFSWWIRVPLTLDVPCLSHRTFRTLWEAPLWGGIVDRVVTALLLLAAVVGVFLLNARCRRTCARIFGLATLLLVGLAAVGMACEPLGRFGTAYLLVPGLLFASIPAGQALALGLDRLYRVLAAPLPVVALVGGVLVSCYYLFPQPVRDWGAPLLHPQPLEIGLNAGQAQVVEALRGQTTPEARILWEDHRLTRTGSRWTALLPLLSERAFVGGLDPEAGIEHTLVGLVEGVLGDRPLSDWRDDELDDFSRRYNIGWVVCWTAPAQERFAHWSKAELVTHLPGSGGAVGQLLRLRRTHSYALTGSITLSSADARHILLANAQPARCGDEPEGQIVLSLHYQRGMQVSPARVRLEKSVELADAIPFVRLRVSEPVSRILITWPGHP